MATVLTVIACIAPWSSQAESKTLDRTVDPIVMECTDFAPLFGVPVEQLALMALEGNTWSPVPFQIDQKKPDGTYAYTTGPRAAPDSDPNLDANDELVFMAGDAGARAEPDALPDAMIAAVELEITDPNNGKTAWAYLGKFEDRAPRSDKDYVKVELNSSTKRWRFTGKEFVIEIPKGYIVPDYLAGIKSDGTGPARPGQDQPGSRCEPD